MVTFTNAQELNFEVPEKLPATVNSPAEEGMPLLSPDGKWLYFTRFGSADNVGGQFSGIDVWTAGREGEGWSNATNKNIPFNNDSNNGIVGISTDGNIFFLIDTSPYKKIKGIYFSKKSKGEWSKPDFVPIPGIDSQGHIGFYVAPDFSIIIISMKRSDSVGEEDLYFSLRDQAGKWSRPKNMGSALNTTGFEISPFLSANKNRLYFSSNGHTGLGDADIFYSDRLYNSWDTWSVPKNLGNKINSTMFDAYFSLHADSIGLFCSNRGGNNADIYRAKILSKNKNEMKDSVNRIIAEAKKMLTDLQVSAKSVKVDGSGPIFFERASILLTLKAKNQLDYLIKQRDKAQRYEIIQYPIGTAESKLADKILDNRTTTILNYLLANGISKEAIAILAEKNVAKPMRQGDVEVKIYLSK